MDKILNRIIYYLPHFFILNVIIICIATSFKVNFNPDLGYYLSISKLIANGLIPFKEFELSYSPLSFYILSIPVLLFKGSFSGQEAFIMVLVFTIINSFILYKILEIFKVESRISLFASCFYLMLVYIAEGRYFVLEPFASTFGLIAIYFIYKKKGGYILYAGLFASLSFLTKQYALAYVPVLLGIIFLDSKTYMDSIKKILLMLIFFILPILLLLLYFYYQVGDFSFLSQQSGSNYGQQKIGLIYDGCKALFTNFILFLPLVVLNFRKLGIFYQKIFISSLIGCCFFSLQFYFATWPHYFIFFYPFIIIPIALSAQSLKNTHILVVIFFILACMPIISDFIKTVRMTNNSDIRREQCLIMEEIEATIDTSKKVCLLGGNIFVSAHLFSELNLKPVNLQNNRFGFETLEENKALTNDADYIIVTKKKMEKIKNYSDEMYRDLLSYDLIFSKKEILILYNSH